MNKEELIKKLTDELEDELEGICEYSKVYDALKSLGFDSEADKIQRIASEEYYHSKILWDILDKMGVDLTNHPKIQNDWANVKRIFAIE